MQKQQQALIDSIQMLKKLHKVYDEEKTMLLNNKSIGGNNGINITELEKATKFFRKRLINIEEKKQGIEKNTVKLKTQLISISKQIMPLNNMLDMPTSEIKIVVTAEKQVSGEIEFTYIIYDASWLPNYDIRIEDVDKPINLIYKAKVKQNTGEKWNNVKLVLSTGNPSINSTKPELSTYYLSFNNYYKNYSNYNQSTPSRPVNGIVRGTITDQSGEALPGATVIVTGDPSVGVVSDMNGNFQLTVPAAYKTLSFSFIGMQTEKRPISSSFMNVKLTNSNISIEEVVITARGVSRLPKHLSGKVAGVNVKGKKSIIPIAIEKRQTSTEFKIKIPYTIPSDNENYDVAMVEYEVPTDYNYYIVPKLSTDAFLVANITDWTELNLLNGNANLYLKGTYQGETFLDLKTFEDTLGISVGRDNDIVVERKMQKEFVSKKLIGTTKKEERAWEIIIKNNKSKAVKLTIEDQYPISKNEDIKVELLEFSGAEKDENTGKLSWKFELAPNEKKSLLIKYSVKYPKNKKVLVE